MVDAGHRPIVAAGCGDRFEVPQPSAGQPNRGDNPAYHPISSPPKKRRKPSRSLFELSATVVWRRGNNFGIEFDSRLRALEDLLKASLTQEISITDYKPQRVFRRRSVDIVSNETTMNSTPFRTGTGTITAHGNVAHISTTVTGSGSPTVEALPPDTVEFALDPLKNKIITIEDRLIELIAADSGGVKFIVRKQ